MGSAVDDIKKLILEQPDNELSQSDTSIPVGKECITLFKLTTAPVEQDCVLHVQEYHRDNGSGQTAAQIVSDFISSGWPAPVVPDENTPIMKISMLDMLFRNQWAPDPNDSTRSNAGYSQMDFRVYGPKVICIEINVPNLYVDPRIISFHKINGSHAHHEYYKNCSANTTTLERMAFSAVGTQQHKDDMKRNDGHKFDLHYVFTDAKPTTDPRKFTRVIFDPKARDGGFP